MSSLSQYYKWVTANPIKTIIIWSLFLKVAILVLYGNITIYPDSDGYIYLGSLISKLNLTAYDGTRSPGYPLLIVLAFNNSYITVVYQMIIGTASLILFYKTALCVSKNKNRSLLISLCLSIYLVSTFYEYAILTETITLFCITAAFYLYVKIVVGKKDSTINFLSLSSLLAYLVLIKPFFIFLPIIFFVRFLFFKPNLKNLITKYILLITLPVVAFLGWSAINKINTGKFVSSTLYGYNLAQTCVSFAENTPIEYKTIADIYVKHRDSAIVNKADVAMSIWYANTELKAKCKLSTDNEISNMLYKYAKVTIAMNPTLYLKQVAISWIDFWKTDIYWDYDSFYFTSMKPIFRLFVNIERLLMTAIKLLFIILIPYNFILCIKRRELSIPTTIGIIVLTASLLQAFTTYGTNSRYSFPFEYLILISLFINIIDLLKQHSNIKQNKLTL